MNPSIPAPPAPVAAFAFRRIAHVAFGADAGYGAHTLVLTFKAQPGRPPERRLFDLAPYLGTGVFRDLRDPSAFRRARVDTETGTVVWPGGQDLSPDHFYDASRPLP